VGKRAGVGGIAVRPSVIATEAAHGRERETAPLLSAPSRSGLGLAATRLFLGVLPPALLILLVVARYLTSKKLGFDYKPLWEASRHVLDGASPYPRPEAWALHDEQQFVYPPLAAFLFAPFAAFPFAVAAPLLAVVELAATGLTLRVLGVRDWRCYGVVLLWYPVLQNFLLGAITSVLALGLAVAWRYRDSRRIAPVALAALIAAKIFLWPMLVWVGASHRWLTVVRALGLAVAGIFLSWAAIGFAGLGSYMRLLDELSRLEQWKSYSAVALGMALGLTGGEARGLALTACALVLVAIVLVQRKGGEDADRQAFVLAIAAAFLFSPIVWTHYLALLVVPIAITRRTLSPIWFVPLAMWASYGQSDGHLWRVALGFSVCAVVLAASLRPAWRLPTFGRPVAMPAAPLSAEGAYAAHRRGG
jgi:glycosyl transferase family 87